MKKRIIILSVLLALQIAVAVGVNLNRHDYGAFEPTEKLLPFDAKDVDSIRIDGPGAEQLALNKQDQQWRLPALNGFPADQGSVGRFLQRLAGLEKGWPVATTKSASKRFKIDDKSFERKLTLFRSGKPQAVLYVGTSPGFRKVHVRVPGQDDIYAVKFSAYEAGTKPEDWIDKKILAHKAEDLQRLELPDFTLLRHDDKLVVAGLAADEETIQDEAKRLLDRIAELNIRSVLGTEDKPEYHQGESSLRYTLTLASGDTQSYVFSKPKGADHYVLKASPRDEYFTVDAWNVDQIKDVSRDKLVRKTKTKKPVETTAPSTHDKTPQSRAGG